MRRKKKFQLLKNPDFEHLCYLSIIAILQIDSTKVKICKSQDGRRQYDTYYNPKNQHYATFLNACTLLGEPIFLAVVSSSSTPRHGDSLLSACLLGKFAFK